MMFGQDFLLAVMSVSLFALLLSISWPRVAATQFTVYMALMNLSMSIGSYGAGMLSGRMSVLQILIVAGVLQAVVVLPAQLINPRQTRQVLGDSLFRRWHDICGTATADGDQATYRTPRSPK